MRTIVKATIAVLLLAPLASAAVGVVLTPTVSSIPANGIQSVTAQITGSTDQRVNWSAPGASIIGSGSTVGIKKTSAGSVTVTATSVADNTKTATATIAFTTAPTPVTTHPRIWVNSTTLPTLQSWAVSTNPVFQNSFLLAVTRARTGVDAHWSWSFAGGGASGAGLPDATWTNADKGTDTGFSDDRITEEVAAVFAFYSLLTTDSATKDAYALRARDMIMWEFNQAALGMQSGAPFRGPTFSYSDRSRASGWAFPAVVDWIYPYLSSQDKATIRTVFLRWGKEQNNANTTANEHPIPVGKINDPVLLADKKHLRWAMNNRGIGPFRTLLLESLALDAADDPVVNAGDAYDKLYSDGSANSVRGYLKSATGAWMYTQWAEYEDRNIVSDAYGIASTGIGDGAGGYSVEGTLYDTALGDIFTALFALHTSGNDDPAVHGPQASFYTSSFWDLRVKSLLHQITPTNAPKATSYYGTIPVFQFMNVGDVQKFYILAATHTTPFTALAAANGFDGLQTSPRFNAANWIAKNGPYDGANRFYGNAGANAWGTGSMAFGSYTNNGLQTIMFFLAFDPAAGVNPTDPRTSLPTDFAALPVGRVFSRTDWTANSSWLGYWCSWIGIDHQVGNCGLMEFFRKGEWFFKERVAYPYQYESYKPQYHNTLAIQNTASTSVYTSGWSNSVVTSGGQWALGQSLTDPTTIASYGLDYTFIHSDMTGLYNYDHPWFSDPDHDALGVTHASRSVMYLKPDLIIVYDRATTATAGLFKRFAMHMVGTLSNVGKDTTLTTAGGQKLFITALLPNTGTTQISTSAADDITGLADAEPTNAKYQITDSSNPADIRFLHTMEATDAGGTPKPTTLVTDSSNSFYGARVGNTIVLFKKNWTDAITGFTYPEVSATQHYIVDLVPNTTYPISGNGAPASAITDAAGVLSFSTAGRGGNITIGQGTPDLVSISVTPSSTSIAIGGTQSFTATGTYSDANTANLTNSVVWSSGTPTVASVTAGGVATGITRGASSITATSGTISGSASLTVDPAPVVTRTKVKGKFCTNCVIK